MIWGSVHHHYYPTTSRDPCHDDDHDDHNGHDDNDNDHDDGQNNDHFTTIIIPLHQEILVMSIRAMTVTMMMLTLERKTIIQDQLSVCA